VTGARARIATAAVVTALVTGAGGCATVIAGGPDHVPIDTNPRGAYVYLNGQVVGQTPTIVTLDRRAPAQIQIYLPGFEPIVMLRDKSLNLWTLGNLLIGVLPIIVDLVTANFEAFDSTPILLGLQPLPPGAPQPQPPSAAPAPQPPAPY
jgi:hypothetical protein